MAFLDLAVPSASGGNALADRHLHLQAVALNGVVLHGRAAWFNAGDVVFTCAGQADGAA